MMSEEVSKPHILRPKPKSPTWSWIIMGNQPQTFKRTLPYFSCDFISFYSILKSILFIFPPSLEHMTCFSFSDHRVFPYDHILFHRSQARTSRQPEARSYIYVEFPEHFVQNKSSASWTPCQRDFSISYLYFAPPSSGERFYLHTLFTVVRSVTSFESLRTYQGIKHSTYKEACLACC